MISDWAHVVQSVGDILSTMHLTRVMRRDYGSENPGLVDQPMTDASLLQFYVAAAEALEQWEPRYSLDEIGFASASRDGKATIVLQGVYRPRGHKGDPTPAEVPDRSITLLLSDDGWRPLT